MRESVLGPNHVDVAQSLHSLATLHNDRDETNIAEELYERALLIRSSMMPPDHPLVLATARSLAVLYRKQVHCYMFIEVYYFVCKNLYLTMFPF